MANNLFQVKRTSVSGRTPNTTDPSNSQYIAAGELALNMPDGILYTSNGSTLLPVGANIVNQRITNSLIINNAKNLNFETINTSAYSFFTQQNDDNFVFYSTNTAYGARPVWGIYANSSTSNLQIYVPLQLNSSLIANGSTGSPGSVLATNGSATYWTTVGGTGTVTQVNSANGVAGGPITGSGTLYAVAGNNTVFVNASGIHVNTDALPAGVNVNAQYVWTNTHTFNETINGTANNATNLGGVAAASYVNTSGNYTLSGNITLGGTNTVISSNLNVTGSFVNIASATVANSSGVYTTGTVNAASHTVGFGTTVNSTGFWTSGAVASNNYIAVTVLGGSFIANGTGAYHSGVMNAATIQASATFTANSTLVNAAAINITNRVNTATFFATTSANVGANVIVNTSTIFVGNTTANLLANSTYITVANSTGNVIITPGTQSINATGTVNAASIRIGATFTVNSSQANISSIPLSANSSNGTAGQILASNGDIGSPYWTAPVGAGYYKGGPSTVGTLASQGQNIFRVNANTLNYNTTIAAGENAQATGPISVNTGITLTISPGARVSII